MFCFHQKPYFLFELRKKELDILDDMDVSKLSAKVFFVVFFFVNYSFKSLTK